MSVRPTSFDNGAGMWTYVHDDVIPQHGGTLDPATVSYAQQHDGTPDYNTLVVPCPDGDAVSYWPAGGGAVPLMGQQMHVAVAYLTPQPGRAALSLTQAADQVKAAVVATDGEPRWVLDDAALQALAAVLKVPAGRI